MKYTPHPFQHLGIVHALDVLRSAGPPTLYAAPTGCGKSVVELKVQEALIAEGHDPWVVTPREEIATGMLEKLGFPDADMLDHRIATPVRYRNRLMDGRLRHPSHLIVDEGHHHSADTWQQLDLLSGLCPSVAYTATPYRGSPRSTKTLRDHWGDPVWLITYKEAAAEGYIKMPDFRILPLVDDDCIDISNGEFDITSIDSATLDRLGDVSEHARAWYKDRWDMPTVFAVPSTACAVRLHQELTSRGLPCVRVDAGTPKSTRYPAFEATVDRITALVHISIVTEGVDLPLRRLVDLAPTLSPVKWVQQLGRITRPTKEQPQYIGCCLAEGTPVLTDSGWKPIQEVQLTDKVWDGVEWVQHDGVANNGIRECIEVAGIQLTPDHEVLTIKGWREACQLESTENLKLGMYASDGQLLLGHQGTTGGFVSIPAATNAPSAKDCCEQAEATFIAKGVIRQGAISYTKGTSLSLAGSSTGNLDSGSFASQRCENGSRCINRGSTTRMKRSNTYSRYPGGIASATGQTISQSTGSTTRRATSPATSGSLRGKSKYRIPTHASNRPNTSSTYSTPDSPAACSSYGTEVTSSIPSLNSTANREVWSDEPSSQRVYDVMNAGPRHRFQAGPLIVHNCRNLLRHAYALDGTVPVSAVLETEAAFPSTSRAHSRVLGLEAIGRFKPTNVKLLSGLKLSVYCLSVAVQSVVVEYCVLVHPVLDPVWASKVNTAVDGVRQYGSWVLCDPPYDVRGFSSVGPRELSEKQAKWWGRAAARYGLDPEQELTRKNFQVLPVLADTGVHF